MKKLMMIILFLGFTAAVMWCAYWNGYDRGLEECKSNADSLQVVLNEMPEKYLMIERYYNE